MEQLSTKDYKSIQSKINYMQFSDGFMFALQLFTCIRLSSVRNEFI